MLIIRSGLIGGSPAYAVANWRFGPLSFLERPYEAAAQVFQKYAGQYELDWLLVMAQAYQESRLEQNLKSGAGAVGVMQLLPSTAAGDPVNILAINPQTRFTVDHG